MGNRVTLQIDRYLFTQNQEKPRETSGDRFEENIDQPSYKKLSDISRPTDFEGLFLVIYKKRRLFTALLEVSQLRLDEIPSATVKILTFLGLRL